MQKQVLARWQQQFVSQSFWLIMTGKLRQIGKETKGRMAGDGLFGYPSLEVNDNIILVKP